MTSQLFLNMSLRNKSHLLSLPLYNSLIQRMMDSAAWSSDCLFIGLNHFKQILKQVLTVSFFFFFLVLRLMLVSSVAKGGVIINLPTPFFPSWFTIYVHLPIMRWLELNQIRFNLQLNCEILFSPKWGCKTNIKLKLLCNFFLLFLSFFLKKSKKTNKQTKTFSISHLQNKASVWAQ